LRGADANAVYNVFGETIEVHTADIGGGPPVSVSKVLVLIWSMQRALLKYLTLHIICFLESPD